MPSLTAYEKQAGWRYSITCTNIPDAGIGGVPGSHHAQYIDVLHREHAVVETAGVRTAKAMGLRNLPSKNWQVNCGWFLAANSKNHPSDTEGGMPGAVGAGAHPGTPGTPRATRPADNQT
jgi:hypothetical protein